MSSTNKEKDNWICKEPHKLQRSRFLLLAQNLRHLLHSINVSADAIIKAGLILVAQRSTGVGEANVEALLLHRLQIRNCEMNRTHLHNLLHVSLVKLVAHVSKSLLELFGGISRHCSFCDVIYVLRLWRRRVKSGSLITKKGLSQKGRTFLSVSVPFHVCPFAKVFQKGA